MEAVASLLSCVLEQQRQTLRHGPQQFSDLVDRQASQPDASRQSLYQLQARGAHTHRIGTMAGLARPGCPTGPQVGPRQRRPHLLLRFARIFLEEALEEADRLLVPACHRIREPEIGANAPGPGQGAVGLAEKLDGLVGSAALDREASP
ncbi:MAG: hypothetical protein WCP21_03465 [Armatimonadota bacterium]